MVAAGTTSVGHGCGCLAWLSSIDGPWVRFRGSEAGLVGLAGEAGALCHGFYGGKVPLPRGAGRRDAPNARNAGISGRDRPATRLLPDHAEEPTRNSLQRKPTHGPSLRFAAGAGGELAGLPSRARTARTRTTVSITKYEPEPVKLATFRGKNAAPLAPCRRWKQPSTPKSEEATGHPRHPCCTPSPTPTQKPLTTGSNTQTASHPPAKTRRTAIQRDRRPVRLAFANEACSGGGGNAD